MPDQVHVFCYTVLPWLNSEHQGFRTVLISVITATAKNRSYLCFSDEETQVGDYVSRVRSVRSVKKSAGCKQTPDFLRSNLVFKKKKTLCYQSMQKYNK